MSDIEYEETDGLEDTNFLIKDGMVAGDLYMNLKNKYDKAVEALKWIEKGKYIGELNVFGTIKTYTEMNSLQGYEGILAEQTLKELGEIE